MRRLILSMVATGGLLIAVAGPVAAHDDPTCADFGPLGVEVHGQHVVRDYVTGGELDGWPAGGGVGSLIAGEGAAVPGGPGPGFHFPNGFAPGASFCLEQSAAPGWHVGD